MLKSLYEEDKELIRKEIRDGGEGVERVEGSTKGN